MKLTGPIVALLSLVTILSIFTDACTGLKLFQSYNAYIYFFFLLPISWVIAIIALVIDRPKKDWLTLVLAASTLGFYPALIALGAFRGIIFLIGDTFAGHIRFSSAASLVEILGRLWYLWGFLAVGAMSWVGWRRWVTIRRLRWFQIVALAFVVPLTFACLFLWGLAEWPLNFVVFPLLLALSGTTFSWMLGRPFRAARLLRRVVGGALPIVVSFSTISDWPDHAFHVSELGIPTMLLALALFFAPDPRRKRKRRQGRTDAAPPTDTAAREGADTNTNAMGSL